jgi:hypothetical protein
VQPSIPSRDDIAAPIPFAPPVTTQTFPSNLFGYIESPFASNITPYFKIVVPLNVSKIFFEVDSSYALFSSWK